MVNWPARGTKPWDTPLKAYLDGSYPDKTATEAAIARVDPGTAGTEGQVLGIAGGVPDWVDPPAGDALPWFLPRDYGTVGAGNDVAAIQGAIDAASGVALATGRTQTVYLEARVWDIPGTTMPRITTSNIRILAEPGALLDAPALAEWDAALEIEGSIATGVTTLDANATKSATTITVASAAGLSVGDLLAIRSAEVFNPDRATIYTKGEFVEIAGIAGTTLTLTSPLQDSYAHATYPVTVDRLTPLRNITIANLAINAGGVTNRYGIRAWYVDGLTFDRVAFFDCKYAGGQAEMCRNVLYDQCHAERCNQSGVGYGMRAFSAEHVTFVGCTGRNNRHTIDVDQVGSGRPVSRHITYRDCTAIEDASAGISTHGGCEYVTIDNCTARGCGGGLVSRGAATSLLNCRVQGVHHGTESYHHGITLGDGGGHTTGVGRAGDRLVIRGCDIDIDNPTATNRHGIWCSASLNGALIEDNRFRGATGNILQLTGYTTRDTRIRRNVLDGSRISGTDLSGIRLAPYAPADGRNQIGLEIDDNRFVSFGARAIQLAGNSVAGANASRDIFIRRNIVESPYILVDLGGGGYYGRVHVDIGVLATPTWIISVNPANIVSLVTTGMSAATPEGVVDGSAGSTWTNLSGGESTTFYRKTGSSVGKTGWVGA